MANEKVIKTLTIDGTKMYGHLDETVNLRAYPLPEISPWVDYVPADTTVTLQPGIYLIRYAFDPAPSIETGVRFLDFTIKAGTSYIGQIQYTDANAGQFAEKNLGTFVKLDAPATITLHLYSSKTIPAGSGADLAYTRIF